jgi:2-polyprenyl-3-methyl-5-hydroxy-6-metoxy-1,4-benzoquinol methylase
MADQGTQGKLSPWLRRQRMQAVAPHLQGRVLDFGCGSGALADLVRPDRYVGYDRDAESVTKARALHPDHRFEFEPPAANGDFRTVACLAVIEHVSDPVDFVRTLATYMQRDGLIVLTTPHPYFEWAHTFGARIGLFSHAAHEEHESLLDKARLSDVASAAGLALQDYQRFLGGANQLATFRYR